MKNIKKYLCAIVMMVISMTAFAQEDVFSGDWLGANKEGDLKVAFTLNCDGNWQLNPYNENARCNGFMEVNMLEPGGRESLMATYEFYVESMNGNELTLSFVGGRPEVDAGISGHYDDDEDTTEKLFEEVLSGYPVVKYKNTAVFAVLDCLHNAAEIKV